MLCSFFRAIPRRKNFMCGHFGTPCSFFIGGVNKNNILLVNTTYEDGIECSETSAHKIQTPGNHPTESIQPYQLPVSLCCSSVHATFSPTFLKQSIFFFRCTAMAQRVRRRPVVEEFRVQSRAVHVWFVADNVALTQFLQVQWYLG